MSALTRNSLLSDLNTCGNLMSKIYYSLEKEYENEEIPFHIKELFTKLNTRFSEIHAKIIKLPKI